MGPAAFVDDPQTHFVRIRMDNVYDVENKGKYIKADRVLRFDVTEFLKLANEFGELNAAQVLDIQDIEPDEETSDEVGIVSKLVTDLYIGGVIQFNSGDFTIT